MDRSLVGDDRPAAAPPRAGWTYWRPGAEGVVELGTLRGQDVGLPTHFHDEHQITFVLSGRRRFRIGGQVVELAAGQGTLIPAGTPHTSISEPSGVVCLNAYVPAGQYAVAAMMQEIQRLWHRTGQIHWDDLMTAIRDHREAELPITTAAPLPADSRVAVGEIAARMGMSREGYTRKFSKRWGMPPHAFRLVSRLNDARRMLRAGEPIAAVAIDAGFADQSHFGRWFRRTFGVTPGQYRAG